MLVNAPVDTEEPDKPVKPPGFMLQLVAPVEVHVKADDCPEVIVVGDALKVSAGPEPLPTVSEELQVWLRAPDVPTIFRV